MGKTITCVMYPFPTKEPEGNRQKCRRLEAGNSMLEIRGSRLEAGNLENVEGWGKDGQLKLNKIE